MSSLKDVSLKDVGLKDVSLKDVVVPKSIGCATKQSTEICADITITHDIKKWLGECEIFDVKSPNG